MAFFGLTALGPQNCFQAHLNSASDLHIFDDHDWSEAFGSVARDEEHILHGQLEQVLLKVFMGPPPIPTDRTRFFDAFADLTEHEITLDMFMDVIK